MSETNTTTDERCSDCNGYGAPHGSECPRGCEDDAVDRNAPGPPTCASCGTAYQAACDTCDGWGYVEADRAGAVHS
jgi:hypothetical protein